MISRLPSMALVAISVIVQTRPAETNRWITDHIVSETPNRLSQLANLYLSQKKLRRARCKGVAGGPGANPGGV